MSYLTRKICRSGDCLLLPGQEENYSAVTRRWIKQTHLVWTRNQEYKTLSNVFDFGLAFLENVGNANKNYLKQKTALLSVSIQIKEEQAEV